MQTKLIAGDSISLLDTYAAYPASAGWVLKCRLVPRAQAGTAITLIAVAEGDSYRTMAGSAATASWATGGYTWSKWVERSDERITLENGSVEVLPDPAGMAAGTDTRGHLERALANIEAMIEGRATKDVQEYTIGDRQLKHIPITELLVWRDKYRFQLAAEGTGAGAVNSFRRGRKIYVRF